MDLISRTLFIFLTIIETILFIRVILSWAPNTDFIIFIKKFIYEITEPILSPIRALIERSIFRGNGNIFDISPLIAFLVIDAIKVFL